MGDLDSKFNALVLVALCVAGYFILQPWARSVQPQRHLVSRDGHRPLGAGAGQIRRPWCGPCRMLDPELDKLANSGRVDVVRVEVDKHPDLARHYGVSSIPRLLLFDHGTVRADRVGIRQLPAIPVLGGRYTVTSPPTSIRQ